MGDRRYEPSEHPYDAQQQALDHESYAMQRSITHGSHHTYASNQSWAPPSIHGASVMSEATQVTQQTPFYGPRQPPQRRPLPNYPATYSYTENHSRQDEAEYIEDEYSAQEQPQENYGYEDPGYYQQQSEEQQHGYYSHHDIPPPEPIPVPQPNEYPTSPQPPSVLGPNKKKTFVGGFVKGFRRVFAGKKGIERRKIERKNTFGTDASGTATITHATEDNTRPVNTLPRYLSNPSIGPSNPQFAHRLSMAPVATPVPPFNPAPILMPNSPPQQIPGEFPGVFVTPPSEGDERRSDEMHYNGASQAGGEHSYYEEQDLQRRYNPQPPEDPRNRTTYVPYSNPTGTVATESQYNPPPSTSRAPTIPQSLPYIPSMTVTSPVIPSFPPGPPPPRPNTRRVSYAATPLPSRRREDPHGMFQPGEPEQHTPYATPPRTPNRPRDASQDYAYEQSMQRHSEMQGPTPTRQRQVNSGPPPRYLPAPTRRPSRSQNRQSSGKNMLSPETVYTTTSGVVSMYDPSFASHLTPIEKFFKGLYNLPWIASRRVTVDYRPPEGKTAFRTSRGFSSWYRSVGQRSKASIDAMSETISSGGMSLRNSVQLLTSPISRRNRNTVEGGMSSNRDRKHQRESSTAKSRHRERRRRRRETMETVNTAPTHRSVSPIVPPVYPYQYPSFPYLVPYGAYPSPQMYPTTAPRGPRHHGRRRRERQQEQSYGYQPMAAPPNGAPMYVFASPQGDGGYHQFPGAVPHYPGAPVSPGYVSYGGYSTTPPGVVPVYQPFPRSVSDG